MKLTAFQIGLYIIFIIVIILISNYYTSTNINHTNNTNLKTEEFTPEEDKLKSVPKGYDKTHPEIELLKHKSFLAIHNFKDKDVLSKTFLKHCNEVMKAMHPLNSFLRRACD